MSGPPEHDAATKARDQGTRRSAPASGGFTTHVVPTPAEHEPENGRAAEETMIDSGLGDGTETHDPDATLASEAWAAGRDDGQATHGVAPRPTTTRDDHADGLPRGTIVGRYVVLESRGAGAMGVVYAAYDPELDRRVAIKVLRGRTRDSSEHRGRLVREAQALARLAHPAVVGVHDVGVHEGRVFVAMEFVDGVTLREWLASERRSWRQVLEVFVQAGEGLAAAHGAGLVHRDFKPDNVMIGHDGRVRVLDFGLARPGRGAARGATFDAAQDAAAPDPSASSFASLERSSPPSMRAGALQSGERSTRPSVRDELMEPTHSGAIVGTPAYMAPEQHLGLEVDAAADQFAYCVALYEAVYGERPFAGATVSALAVAITEGVVRDAPRGSTVPGWLRRTLLTGLATEPARRHADMASLLAELRRGMSGGSRVSSWLAFGSLTLALAVAGYAGLVRDEGPVCTGGDVRMSTVWSEARREELAAQLTDRAPHLRDAAERVFEHVDDWASRWRAGWRSACEATNVERVQSRAAMDRRVACLERGRISLASFLVGVERGDAETYERAVDAVLKLPAPEECVDAERLAETLDVPQDPAAARQVRDIRLALAAVESTADLGRAAEAAERLARVEARANPLGFGPLRAEVALARGRVFAAAGQTAESVSRLEDAYFVALAHRRHDLALAAAADLVYTLAFLEMRSEDAIRWSRHADALSSAWDPGGLGQAKVEQALGVLEDTLGRHEAARRHYQRALEIRAARLPVDHPDVARSLNGLGNLEVASGNYAEAEQLYVEALAIRERAYGPQHPIVAGSLNNLSLVHRRRAQYDEGRAVLERAIAILEGAHGKNHPSLARPLTNLAVVERLAGRLDEAERHARRGLAIRLASHGEQHVELADGWAELGRIAAARGDRSAAIEHLRAAEERYRLAFSDLHSDRVEAAVSLAESLLEEGDVAACLALLEPLEGKLSPSDHEPAVRDAFEAVIARARLR